MTYDLYLPSTEDVRSYLADIRGQDMLPPGTLHLLVGDFHSFTKLAIFIDDVPAEPSRAEQVDMLERSLKALTEVITVHSVLLAVGRAGGSDVTASDLGWRDAFGAVVAAAEVDSHGVYVVTENHVGRLGGPASSAP